MTSPLTCCNTAVICSTEKRLFFTARPPGRLAGLYRETHSRDGLKNPGPLTRLGSLTSGLDYGRHDEQSPSLRSRNHGRGFYLPKRQHAGGARNVRVNLGLSAPQTGTRT